MRHWAGSTVLHRRAKVHSLACEFAMRPTMVSLLTLLLLAGSHARAQVPGPVDPTDLMVRVLNIDGVRCELLLRPNANMLAVSVTASSFVINDYEKPKDYSHFFGFKPDPIWPAGVLNSPEVSCHASSMPPPFRAPSCSLPPTRSPHSHLCHWVRTSSR